MNVQDERCLLVVGIKQSITIRPIVCDLRNFFVCYENKDLPSSPSASCPEPTLSNPELIKDHTKFLQTAPNSKYLYPEGFPTLDPIKAEQICTELKVEHASIQTLADFLHILEFIENNELFQKYGADKDKIFSISIRGGAKNNRGIYIMPDGKLLPFQLFPLHASQYYVLVA